MNALKGISYGEDINKIMRFRQFLEMPLSSYRSEFHTQPDGVEGFGKVGRKADRGKQVEIGPTGREREITGRFSMKDRAIISHPKTMRTLEARLSRGRHRFNIIMIERKDAQYYEQVGKFIRDNGIQTEEHITFVKNGTSGHLMTPWMILHTLGHAVASNSTKASKDLFRNQLRLFTERLCGMYLPEKNTWSQLRTCMQRAGEVFMFKSAQEGSQDTSFADSEEFLHETIAEYLWNGDTIRMRSPHDRDEEMTAVVAGMEKIIGDMLDECVDKIIYDEFD